MHERSKCISYDYVGDDIGDLLMENDLNIVYSPVSLATTLSAL
jgi:hypothetical protein